MEEDTRSLAQRINDALIAAFEHGQAAQRMADAVNENNEAFSEVLKGMQAINDLISIPPKEEQN